MNCRDLEPLIYPYLDEELVDGERVSIEAHLAGCVSCTALVERERRAISVIRAAAKDGTPRISDELRDRLLTGVRGQERGFRRARVARITAVAAGFVAVAFAGNQVWHGYQRRLFVESAASRHARQLPLEFQGAPEAMESWLGGKLDHHVNVPRFPNLRAAGARLLNVRDRDAAYIRYDAPRPNSAQPHQLGLFVFNDDSGDVNVGSVQNSELGNSHGFNVVTWRDGDVVYQLVTDLDEHDIRQLLPPTAGAAVAAPTMIPSNEPAHQVPLDLPVAPPRPTLDVRPASMTRQ